MKPVYVDEYLTTTKSLSAISKEFGVPVGTIKMNVDKYRETPAVEPKSLEELNALISTYGEVAGKYIVGGKAEIKHLLLSLDGGTEFIKTAYYEGVLTNKEIAEEMVNQGRPGITKDTIKTFVSNHSLERKELSVEEKKVLRAKWDSERMDTQEKKYGDRNYNIHMAHKSYEDKTGYKNPLDSPDVRKKTLDTMLEKYGVEYSGQSRRLLKKAHDTVKDKYGDEHFFKTGAFKTKRDKRNKEVFGTDLYTKSSEYKYENISWSGGVFSSKKEAVEILLNSNKLEDFLLEVPEDNRSRETVSEMLGIPLTTVNRYIRESGLSRLMPVRSNTQKETELFIRGLTSFKVLVNTRPSFMNGLELDVYVPALKVAFEYNGSYWHSEEQGKNNDYHKNKTELARKAEVSLMHIWEYDWVNPIKQDIIKSQIAYKLHSDKVTHYYARKLELREVPYTEYREFMNINHIQGSAMASIRYGLYSGEELIACMSFSKTHKVRQEEYELKRFATKKYTSVAGGMSKLLKHFIKEHGTDLMSYANNDFAHEHASYEQLGFSKIGTTVPGYKWIRSDEVVSRQKVQVAKLKSDNIPFKQKAGWEDGDTEVSFMTKNGFHKVYDAGNDIYVYNG